MDAPSSLTRRSLLASAAVPALPQDLPAPLPDLPRPLYPTAADSGSIYPLIEKMAGNQLYPLSFLNKDFTSFDAYRDRARTAVLDALGSRPAPVQPNAEVLDRRDMGGYFREKILFSTTPHFRVPAYVLIPKNLKDPAPAIVDLHSHGGMFLFGKEKVTDLGRNHPAMTVYHQENYEGRPTATALVRRGYVVITIDAFPFGERRIMMDADLGAGYERSKYSIDEVRRMNRVCASKEDTVVKSLTYAGLTWPGVVTWDDMRTVDYLATRPEVDAQRIGCCGVSFGGWRSLLLSGLDPRIQAGCVAGFMSTVRPMIRRHMDTHSFVHFIPLLHRLMDLPDVVALRCPKPLLVLQCRRDGLFPLSGMAAAVEKIAAIYRKAGPASRTVGHGGFTSRFYDVPHIFNAQMQDDAFAWFDGILKPMA
ncbi:MAG TPA: alpha/beta hydrolase family protein [Bryobacteraceae bacterium]|nr:alpha/beta hydrolase family protein [Bryobacteraceae bacterium]HPT26895.1 alpha/beta hydrolase family protein [Bryobacteraceae bacterium]